MVTQFDNESNKRLKVEILDFFRYSITSNDNRSLLSIGSVTDEGRHLLESLRGEPFKSDIVDFVLNPSNLRHIYNEHYGINEKDPGNNIPLTDEDIMLIGSMLENTTDVVYGIDKKTGNKLFFFLSKSSGGAYNLAEIYSNTNGNLSIKSLYNTKKGPSQRVMALMSTLLSTSVTYSGSTLSSGAKIPKLFELHKNFEEKIPLDRNFRVFKVATEHGVSFEDVQEYIYSDLHNSREHTDDVFNKMTLKFRLSHPNLDKDVVGQMMSYFRNDIDEIIENHLRYRKSADWSAYRFPEGSHVTSLNAGRSAKHPGRDFANAVVNGKEVVALLTKEQTLALRDGRATMEQAFMANKDFSGKVDMVLHPERMKQLMETSDKAARQQDKQSVIRR